METIKSEDQSSSENSSLDDNKPMISNEFIIYRKRIDIEVSVGRSWFDAFLKNEFEKPYFHALCAFIECRRQIPSVSVFPKRDDVWVWTKECSINEVKVVIIGQEPYHSPGEANGLSFSVSLGMKIPRSLANIYTELENDLGSEKFKRPNHGNLVGWARQGVLLLNSAFTSEDRKGISHEKLWEKLTYSVIQYLNKNKRDLVFMLWGVEAQKTEKVIDPEIHFILKAAHPSPLSANKGFFKCRHFSTCNRFLVDKGKTLINWNDLPEN